MPKHPKFLAAAGLAAFSPFVAEFLLGDQYLGGRGPSLAQIPEYVLFLIYYGSAAVLIREFARRTGRGWPTIVLCALAFGLFEEGLLTQTLFRPVYLGLRLLDYGYVGPLGIGLPWTLLVLTLHTVWSISAPIAVIERAAPREPWLHGRGIIICGALLVLGAAGIFVTSFFPAKFLASSAQLIVTAVLIIGLLVLAYRIPRRASPVGNRTVSPVLLAVGAAVLSSGFELAQRARMDHSLSPWLDSAILLILQLAAVSGITLLARRTRWGPAQVFGLGAGAVLTYCWVGFENAIAAGTGAIIEQSVLAVLALGILALIARSPAARTA